ncbi:hypothetical protein DFH07DRAFT_1029780 [Mycena maculata]|uniref:Uncharacterized protein n=1 Tax=Mycena maculata TaxID=230809 RepID=A0AAD7J1J7_9AGAR|nr:hypothetical protein DFH07DRAFT_1029780 [Mycena maculata]
MPELPRELEREIFELAIGSNRHNAAFKLTLNLVAHRVHLWVDRVFYEVVSISGKRHAAKFLDLIDSNSKSSGFFSVVKALSLRVMIQETQIHKILSACSAVQLLDCYAHCWPGSVWKRTLLAIVQLPLRRFSVNFEFVSEIPITPVNLALPPQAHISL